MIGFWCHPCGQDWEVEDHNVAALGNAGAEPREGDPSGSHSGNGR
jgi:hypothetical protein